MSKENPLIHEIHVSEIKEFKKCRFSHKLKFVDQLYPLTTARQLEFGTAFHAALEVYYDPETWSYPNDVKKNLAILMFIKVCEDQKNKLDVVSEERVADFNDRIDLGVGMLTYYFNDVAPMLDLNLEPIFVEKNFSIPIYKPGTKIQLICFCDKCFEKWRVAYPNELYNEFDGLPVFLEGKIDLIFRDKKTGRIWILDWKTTAKIMENHEWLEMDEQLMFYLFALKYVLEADIAGFMYHEMLKAYPQPPKVNKTRRLGRIYSVDKTQDTNYDLYIEAVTSGDPEGFEAGAYDEFLSFLENSPKEFYHREIIRKDERHLELAHRDLFAVVSEIVNERKILYPTPSRYGCGNCDFQQVCIGRATLGDYEYTLSSQFERKVPYYEQQ